MGTARKHEVHVHPLPAWLDAARLLGPGFDVEASPDGSLRARALLDRAEAADVQARLRGVGLDGRRVVCEVLPALHRREVREARLLDARRRRAASVGFSRGGVQLDEEGRVSLTPEALALELGSQAAGLRVIDAGCGVGGNAIGFARGGATVLAIERDAERLRMARHNASVYGVADRIDFVLGDAAELLSGRSADLLFLDPPWGTDWDRERTVVESLPPLAALLEAGRHLPRVWVKVPPSFQVSSVAGAHARAVFGAGEGDRHRVKFVLLTLGA